MVGRGGLGRGGAGWDVWGWVGRLRVGLRAAPQPARRGNGGGPKPAESESLFSAELNM